MKVGLRRGSQRGCIGVEFGDNDVRMMHLVVDVVNGVPGIVIENVSVVAWSTPGDQAEAVRTAWSELETDEKRCAVALSPPNIVVRPLTAHKRMPQRDIRKAALEDVRGLGFTDVDPMHFRRVDDRTMAVGIARVNAIDELEQLISHAGLRVVAIEHEAYAWTRAMGLNGDDLKATLDIRAGSVVLAVRGEQFSDLVGFPRPEVGIGTLASDVAMKLRKAGENGFANVSILGIRISHETDARLTDESESLVHSIASLAHLQTRPLTLADDAELTRGLLAWSLAKGYLDSLSLGRAA